MGTVFLRSQRLPRQELGACADSTTAWDPRHFSDIKSLDDTVPLIFRSDAPSILQASERKEIHPTFKLGDDFCLRKELEAAITGPGFTSLAPCQRTNLSGLHSLREDPNGQMMDDKLDEKEDAQGKAKVKDTSLESHSGSQQTPLDLRHYRITEDLSASFEAGLMASLVAAASGLPIATDEDDGEKDHWTEEPDDGIGMDTGNLDRASLVNNKSFAVSFLSQTAQKVRIIQQTNGIGFTGVMLFFGRLKYGVLLPVF
ncbi:unnamed protein product [Protopolystoma xenopodis]|uniref:Uncharacterized protein n=1 Tax=Protopolystoma xenopodis TaxID=117903 RepID=A0A3S5ARQ0_9PLAT|nr:unnamed protein product [Protopolystoma xenopodis]